VEQQVLDAREAAPREEVGALRPDAGQRRQRTRERRPDLLSGPATER
jgi:hypothetical protein